MTSSIRGLWIHGALAAVALAWLGCAGNRPVADQVSDATITAEVKTKITAQEGINPLSLDVDTRDGVVVLRGIVDDEEDRIGAERLARDTRGVVEVVNQLQLGDENDLERSANDATVSARVKARIAADPVVDALDIDVDTIQGVVTLSGVVDNESERSSAELVARDTPGVRGVHNELQVRGEDQPPLDETRDVID